jgi:hypothetical protein
MLQQYFVKCFVDRFKKNHLAVPERRRRAGRLGKISPQYSMFRLTPVASRRASSWPGALFVGSRGRCRKNDLDSCSITARPPYGGQFQHAQDYWPALPTRLRRSFLLPAGEIMARRLRNRSEAGAERPPTEGLRRTLWRADVFNLRPVTARGRAPFISSRDRARRETRQPYEFRQRPLANALRHQRNRITLNAAPFYRPRRRSPGI